MKDSNEATQRPQSDPEDDPEIAALLNFTPVPRKMKRENGWDGEMQRRFIRLIVETGTAQRAAQAIGKRLSGVEAVYHDDELGEFRASWDAAEVLGRARYLKALDPDVARRRSAGEREPPHRRAQATAVLPNAAVARDDAPALHVVCDGCAATGIAGDERFAGIPDILDFDPVPPSLRAGAWDEALQRRFVAALAATGSIRLAARTVNRHPRVVERMRKMRGGRSFSEACDAALDLARERELAAMAPALRQAQDARADDDGFDAYGDDEDAASLEARGREAVDRIREKLLGCRRLFLQEICLDADKRAAWDLLCGPADWGQAAAFEAQPDEAEHKVNLRQPDMVATAASGWMDGPLGMPGAQEQLLKRIDGMSAKAKTARFERQDIVPLASTGPSPFNGEKPQPRENDNPSAVWVCADDEEAAHEAFQEWQRHVDAGRVGQSTEPKPNDAEGDASD